MTQPPACRFAESYVAARKTKSENACRTVYLADAGVELYSEYTVDCSTQRRAVWACRPINAAMYHTYMLGLKGVAFERCYGQQRNSSHTAYLVITHNICCMCTHCTWTNVSLSGMFRRTRACWERSAALGMWPCNQLSSRHVVLILKSQANLWRCRLLLIS